MLKEEKITSPKIETIATEMLNGLVNSDVVGTKESIRNGVIRSASYLVMYCKLIGNLEVVEKIIKGKTSAMLCELKRSNKFEEEKEEEKCG